MLVLEVKFKKALEMPLSYFEMSDLINIYVLNFGIVNFWSKTINLHFYSN